MRAQMGDVRCEPIGKQTIPTGEVGLIDEPRQEECTIRIRC